MHRKKCIVGLPVLLFFAGMTAMADMKPADIFSDHMVLQRDTDVPVWGKASPGEEVMVEFSGQKKTAKTDEKGNWKLTLAPLKATQAPAELTVSSKSGKTVIRDVLVGVVWLASGQSNMAVPILEALNPQDEIKNADYPLIREFTVKKDWNTKTQDSLSDSSWFVISPETAGKRSAVGFFFARSLQKELNVPVGIINSSFAGSRAEAWLPYEFIKNNADDKNVYGRLLKEFRKYDANTKEGLEKESDALNDAMRLKDPGNAGEGNNWHLPRTDVSKWQDAKVPSSIQSVYGEFNGIYWYRRDIELPKEWAGQELTLELGAVDDMDITYFNGVKVGSTDASTPSWWEQKRVYKIPSGLVKAGKNVIAVRVFDERHAGGIMGPELKLVKAGSEPLDLAGTWKTKAEHIMTSMPFTGRLYEIVKIYQTPAFLHNAMINSIIPYAIDGVIWYQGESNAGNAAGYKTVFADLINSWRSSWNTPEMPFYFVQLAAFKQKTDDPNRKSDWANLRDAQTATLSVPGTGMATAVDIGDEKNIHPLNKQEVGRRLAIVALAKKYGKKLEFSGPMFSSAQKEGSKVRIKFSHAEGLSAKTSPVKGFAIAGNDGKFVWAEAGLDGNDILVWSDKVAEPKEVRFGWADNPDIHVYNAAGLPAIPFSIKIP